MSSVREILLSTIKHGTIIVLVGAMALYTGLILWRLFVRLDSARHPLKTYGDIAERIFGKTARHVCTALQSLQLLLNVRHSPLLYASWLINMMHIRLRQFAWAMVKRSLKCPKAGYVYRLITWDRFFYRYDSYVSPCASSYGHCWATFLGRFVLWRYEYTTYLRKDILTHHTGRTMDGLQTEPCGKRLW